MSSPASFTWSYGSVQVPRHQISSIITNGRPCIADAGYDDIHAGAIVTIENASGTIIATPKLQAGMTVGINLNISQYSGQCQFVFAIHHLAISNFYRVQVGNESRGTVQFTKADAKKDALNVIIQ